MAGRPGEDTGYAADVLHSVGKECEVEGRCRRRVEVVEGVLNGFGDPLQDRRLTQRCAFPLLRNGILSA